MKNKFLPAAAMAAFLSLSIAAFAADANRKKNALGKVDADKDGKITEAEFVAAMKDRLDEAKAKAAFAKRDKNHDGVLTADEMKTVAEDRKEGAKKRKDAAR